MEIKTVINIGERIRMIRMLRKAFIDETAHILCMDVKDYIAVENNERDFSLGEIYKFSHLMNISVDFLLYTDLRQKNEWIFNKNHDDGGNPIIMIAPKRMPEALKNLVTEIENEWLNLLKEYRCQYNMLIGRRKDYTRVLPDWEHLTTSCMGVLNTHGLSCFSDPVVIVVLDKLENMLENSSFKKTAENAKFMLRHELGHCLLEDIFTRCGRDSEIVKLLDKANRESCDYIEQNSTIPVEEAFLQLTRPKERLANFMVGISFQEYITRYIKITALMEKKKKPKKELIAKEKSQNQKNLDNSELDELIASEEKRLGG